MMIDDVAALSWKKLLGLLGRVFFFFFGHVLFLPRLGAVSVISRWRLQGRRYAAKVHERMSTAR